MKSRQSLIPNLNPSSSDKFYVSNVFFLVQKRTSFTLFFLKGGGAADPLLNTIYTILIPCWTKEKIKEVQTKSRIKTTYLTP